MLQTQKANPLVHISDGQKTRQCATDKRNTIRTKQDREILALAFATRACVCTLHSIKSATRVDAKLFPEKRKRADSRKAVSPKHQTGIT